jgi:DNA invertase Pin-like site-specific DNA recombinase
MNRRQSKPLSQADSGLPKTGDYGKGHGRRVPNVVESSHSVHGKLGGRPRVPVDVDAVRRLRDQGLSWRQVARRLGVGSGTARRAAGGQRMDGDPPSVPEATQPQKRGAA